MARRSLTDASSRNHSSQWLPTPWSGLRNKEPDRKLSLLQCQNVQNQTKRIVFQACRLKLNLHLYPNEGSSERAFDPSLSALSSRARGSPAIRSPYGIRYRPTTLPA